MAGQAVLTAQQVPGLQSRWTAQAVNTGAHAVLSQFGYARALSCVGCGSPATSLHAVVAAYGDAGHVDQIRALVRACAPSATFTVVNKDPTRPIRGAIDRPNLGRDGKTFFEYIVKHYDSLPERLPALLANHLQDPFYCDSEGTLEDLRDYQLDANGGLPLTPASPRPLWRWVESHVGEFDGSVPRCADGVVLTSRTLVWARPKSFYAHVLSTLDSTAGEASFYLDALPHLT